MQNLARKHKAYSYGIYKTDIDILEKKLGNATQKSNKLFSLAQNEPEQKLTNNISPIRKKSEEEFDLSEPATPFGLRKVLYPAAIIKKFADIAEENTKNRIETCGILCGAEGENNTFYIKNILIPDQKGNSDSCTTLNYEAILKYVMLNNMIVLGWIHTHPEYACFLSSIDLHTQYSYQKLLPEAIAIVYSGLNVEPSEKYF